MADDFIPPIPPKALAVMPEEPFERWLAQQALQGYDRRWLERNRPALKERWARDPVGQLPPPAPAEPGKVPDRYDEL